MRDNLQVCPGYVDAVRRENEVRDGAFLDVPRFICGICVKPMTLRHWLVLDAIDSPFLGDSKRLPSNTDISRFLWVLSPLFGPVKNWNFFRRIPFLRSIERWLWANLTVKGRFISRVGKIPYADSVAEIRKFVEETFQDSPPSSGDNNIPDYSHAASVVFSLCKTCNLTRNDALLISLPEVFQYLKIERMLSAAKCGHKFISWNPSDTVKAAGIRLIREQQKIDREKQQEADLNG